VTRTALAASANLFEICRFSDHIDHIDYIKTLYSSKGLLIQGIIEARLSSALADVDLPVLFQQFLCNPAIGFHTKQ